MVVLGWISPVPNCSADGLDDLVSEPAFEGTGHRFP